MLAKFVILKLVPLEIQTNRTFTAEELLQLENLLDDTEAENLLSKHDTIREIMENFNFEKVHNYMLQHNWGWFSTDFEVPTVEDIRNQALKLVSEVLNQEAPVCYQGTGGLLVLKMEEHVELMFVPVDWTCDRRL